MSKPPEPPLAGESGLVFRAIADPTRREILDLLRESGPLRAGDIAAHFDQVTRIAVSKHLHVLHDSHLVQMVDSADARERHYALNAAGLGEVRAWLQRYDTFWQQHLRTLKRLAEAQPTDSQ